MGFIRSYTVRYRTVVGRRRQEFTKSVPSSSSSTVIGKLEGGRQYAVSVTASTGAGPGDRSEERVVTLSTAQGVCVCVCVCVCHM